MSIVLLKRSLSLFTVLVFSIGSLMAGSWTVTNTSGVKTTSGSLTWAIVQANAAGAGTHTINFDPALVSGGSITITPALGDLDITNSNVTINGWSVFGATPACGTLPKIKVIANGFNGWEVFGANNTIQGLCIHGGIQLKGTGSHKILGNHFNIDLNGTTILATTAAAAVYITAGGNNIVGGLNDCERNIMASAGTSAIYDRNGGGGNKYYGNYMGTYKDGITATAASRFSGTVILIMTANAWAEGNVVTRGVRGIFNDGGGLTTLKNNNVGANKNRLFDATLNLTGTPIAFDGGVADNSLIDGNVSGNTTIVGGYPTGGNIIIEDAGNDNITITNNYVGVDIAYNKAGSAWCGIFTRGSSATITNNIIGDNGIRDSQFSHGIGTEGGLNAIISNNYIGVSPTGLDIGNGDDGIEVNGTDNYTVSGNIIGFNKGLRSSKSAGIVLVNGANIGSVLNNYVGVMPNLTNCGNLEHGISVFQGSQITIQGNQIAYNVLTAVDLDPGAAVDRIKISQNCMWCNGSRGINLNTSRNGGFGIFSGGTVRINAWGVGGTNSDSVSTAGIWRIKGTCPVSATPVVIELFKTGPCKPFTAGSNEIQGQVFIASTTTTTGAWTIDIAEGSVGRGLVATATDVSAAVLPGRTSEFSNHLALAAPCNIHEYVNIVKGAPLILCEGDPLNIVALYQLKPYVNCDNTVKFTWLKDGGTVAGPSLSYNDYSVGSVTLSDAGTYSLNVVDAIPEANPCSNLTTPVKTTDTIQVIVKPASICCSPKTIDTQPDDVITCEGTDALFSVSVTGISLTYQWQRNTGSGFADIALATNNNYTENAVTDAMNGYQYRVIIRTDGKCPENSDVVTLTVNFKPEVISSPASSVCENLLWPGVTLDADVVGTTFSWTSSASAGVTGNTLNGTGDLPNQTFANSGASPGTVTYAITPTANSCPGDVANHVVTVNQPPAAPAVSSPVTYCLNDVADVLLATGPGLKWYDAAINGNLLGSSVTPSTSSAGTTSYWVSSSIGSCEGPRSQLDVDVINVPLAPTSASPDRNNLCSDDAGNIILTAVGGLGTTLAWYSGSCGGTLEGTGNNLSIASPSVTTTYFVRWETASCSNSSCAQVVININTAPADPTSVTVDLPSICANYSGNVLLTATGGSGGTLAWYATSCGGSSVGTGSSLSLSAPATSTTYYARWERANCIASNCLDASVTVIPAPSPSITGSASLCPNITLQSYSTPSTANTFTWSSTGGITITSGAATNAVEVSSGTTNGSLTVTEDNGSCDASLTLNITVLPATPQAETGPGISSCQTFADLSANANIGGSWSVAQGAGTFSNANDAEATVTGLASGINKFVWTITDACGFTTDTLTVNTAASGLVLTAASSTSGISCAGQESTITSDVTGGSGDYSINLYSIDGTFNSVTASSSIIVSPMVTTEYVAIATDNQQAGCASNRDTVTINVIASQNLFIPNLLTPNKDGKNDFLEINDVDGAPMLDGSVLEIYNRYGQAVFRSNDYKNDFDPSTLVNGMYFLHLKAGCGDKEYKMWIHIVGEAD